MRCLQLIHWFSCLQGHFWKKGEEEGQITQAAQKTQEAAAVSRSPAVAAVAAFVQWLSCSRLAAIQRRTRVPVCLCIV